MSVARNCLACRVSTILSQSLILLQRALLCCNMVLSLLKRLSSSMKLKMCDRGAGGRRVGRSVESPEVIFLLSPPESPLADVDRENLEEVWPDTAKGPNKRRIRKELSNGNMIQWREIISWLHVVQRESRLEAHPIGTTLGVDSVLSRLKILLTASSMPEESWTNAS